MKQNSRTIRKVGLTGSIGSGKSTAARRFNALGAAVLDADAVSHRLLEEDAASIQQTISVFGDGILSENGKISRKKLASIVFYDSAARELLNGIIHPRVINLLYKKADAILKEFPDKIIVFDVPLLFECGMDNELDYTVVITADADVRLQRIMARDACTVDEAKARLSSQLTDEEKIRRADACIDNSTSMDALYAQVDALYHRLKEFACYAK